MRYFVRRRWQDDGLASVGLRPVNLFGKLEDASSFAAGYLDDQQVLSVFTLIDLAGMNRVRHRLNDALEVKVERVRDWLRARLIHPRQADFHPHVSVHEVEAWILAEGVALSQRLRDPSIAPDPKAEVKDFQNPPSKQISELFLRSKEKRRYQKIEDGERLFSRMEFQTVYDSCQYFRKFYDDLKAAARQ